MRETESECCCLGIVLIFLIFVAVLNLRICL